MSHRHCNVSCIFWYSAAFSYSSVVHCVLITGLPGVSKSRAHPRFQFDLRGRFLAYFALRIFDTCDYRSGTLAYTLLLILVPSRRVPAFERPLEINARATSVTNRSFF